MFWLGSVLICYVLGQQFYTVLRGAILENTQFQGYRHNIQQENNHIKNVIGINRLKKQSSFK